MGRFVFGIAALALGIASLLLHDQLISEWQLPGSAAFIVVTSVAQMIGGTAMLFRRTDRMGALILGIAYLVATLTLVPDIVAQPLVYASWGNVFYGLALVAGAGAACGWRGAATLMGLCSISFAIEQVEFLARTVSLVPAWVPPGAMFWAIATAIAFGLAGLALVIGYRTLLASRLLGLMLVLFGVAVWIPILIADPKTHSNWSEGIETFAIGGAAWLVSDLLVRRRRSRRRRGE